jgi:Protein of unknown function (DUF3053)
MRSSVGQPVQGLPHRAVRAVIVILALALPLGACGPSEPQQRQALISFLNEHLLGKPGIHLPVPPEEMRKSWGPYAAHYTVIQDGYHAINGSVKTFYDDYHSLGRGVVMISSLMGKRGEIVRTRDAVAALPATLKKQIETANAARAGLAQPEDLKAVFDKAFERDVTKLGELWLEAAPVLQRTLNSYLEIVDFAEQHKAALEINGAMVTPKDEKLVPRLQELMNAVQNNISAANAEISKGNSVIRSAQ